MYLSVPQHCFSVITYANHIDVVLSGATNVSSVLHARNDDLCTSTFNQMRLRPSCQAAQLAVVPLWSGGAAGRAVDSVF